MYKLGGTCDTRNKTAEVEIQIKNLYKRHLTRDNVVEPLEFRKTLF